MNFDDGEVLPRLNDNWNFMGANAMEWSAGLAVFLLISLLSDSPGRVMPLMLLGWVSTTVMLAMLSQYVSG